MLVPFTETGNIEGGRGIVCVCVRARVCGGRGLVTSEHHYGLLFLFGNTSCDACPITEEISIRQHYESRVQRRALDRQ